MKAELARLDGLQIARAIAAIAVVLTHAIAHPFPGAPGAVHLLGRFGVTLFFVISGYIMVYTTGAGTFAPIDFMQRRLLRIVPPYYAATALTVLGVLLFPNAFKETIYDFGHLVKSLLFIPAYEPRGSGRIDPVLRLGWTLNFEIFFYAVFAALFFLSARGRALALTLIFGGLILLGQFATFENAIAIFYTRIDTLAFVAGVWLALFHQRSEAEPSAGEALLLGGLSLLQLALMAWFYPVLKDNPWTQVWLVGICVMLALALLRIQAGRHGLMWRLGLECGDASYSIYLFHMFGVGVSTVLGRMLLPPSWLPLVMIASFGLGLLAGLMAYYLFERPLMQSIRRWRSRKAP